MVKVRNPFIAALAILCCAVARPPVARAFPYTDKPVRANPAMEARVADELWKLASRPPERIITSEGQAWGYDPNETLMQGAIALAKLGRLDRALQLVGRMPNKDKGVTNGAPLTRDEVLRLTVRRRCLWDNLSGAASLIPAIKNPGLRADALLALARAHIRRGEKVAARRALYRIPALVPGDTEALAYTAYQLSRAKDGVAAQRLFNRIIAHLPPIASPDSNNWREDNNNGLRYYVAECLLRAGFVDRWEKVIGSTRPRLGIDLISVLVQRNRTGAALRLVHEYNALETVFGLCAVAVAQPSNQNVRAKQILEEAAKNYRTAKSTPPKDSESDYKRGLADASLILAYGYRQIGDRAKSEQWRQEALQVDNSRSQWEIKLLWTISPLAYAREMHREPTNEELDQVENEIRPLLSKFEKLTPAGYSESYQFLDYWLQAELAAGRKTTLRDAMPMVEGLVLGALPNIKKLDYFTPIVDTALLWWQLGEETRAQALLKKLDTWRTRAPYTQRDHAIRLVVNGFSKEDQARLKKLPLPSPDNRLSPSAVYYVLLYQPDIFPPWVSQITVPRQRLQALLDMSRALTEPLLERGEEREFVYSTTSRSISF